MMENSSSVNGTVTVNVPGIIIGSITLTIMITAIVGNFLVLLAIARTKALQRLNNYLILSLALSDFGVAFLGMPFFIKHQFEGGWFLPESVCMLYQVLDISFDVLSVVNLTAISIERVFIIAQPLSYHRIVTSCRMITLIVCMWLVCFTYGSLQVLWFNTEEYREFKVKFPHSCSYYPSLAFAIIDFVFTFIIPLIIMFVSYFHIFRIVNSHMSRMHGRQSMISDTPTADFSTYAPSHLYSEAQMAWTNQSKSLDLDSGYNTLVYRNKRHASVPGKSEDVPSLVSLQSKRRKTEQLSNHVYEDIIRPRAFTMPNTSSVINLPGCPHSNEALSDENSLIDGEKFAYNTRTQKKRMTPPIIGSRSYTWPCMQSTDDILVLDKKENISLSHGNYKADLPTLQQIETAAKNKSCFSLPRPNTFTALSILKQNSSHEKEDEDNHRISVTFSIPNDSRNKSVILDSEMSGTSSAKDTIKTILSDSGRKIRKFSDPGNETKQATNIQPIRHTKARSVSQTETIRGSKISRETTDAQTIELSSGADQDVPLPQRRRRSSIRRVLRENKAVKMTAAVIGAFVLCWMPYEIIFITNRACNACIPPTIINALLALVYFSSAINPFIYNFYSKEFRKAIRKSIMCEQNTVQPSLETF